MIKKSLLKVLILLSFASFEGNANNTSSDQDETIKIVTLSPHLAEMIYELGSESSLVGVSSFTDYPESAKSIPRIGDAFVLDLERMTLLDPDVILAWESGTPRKVVEELDNLGYRLEIIKSNNLNEISAALNQIGQIVDKQEQARVIIKKYSDQLKDLKEKYKNKQKVAVFFQIDQQPLFTIGGNHFISEMIEVCAGTNVFSELEQLAPSVSVESVIARDPQVIMSMAKAKSQSDFQYWKKFGNLSANKYDNFYYLHSDALERPTTRIISAGEELCKKLEEARLKLETTVKN